MIRVVCEFRDLTWRQGNSPGLRFGDWSGLCGFSRPAAAATADDAKPPVKRPRSSLEGYASRSNRQRDQLPSASC
ncbi:hypothetical protein Plhal304r1_c010g0040961 [Plasmopara halstedii]